MNDQQIYAIMAKTPNIMAVQIADRLDAPLKDVSEMLRGLVEVGEVVAHSGIGPNQRPAQMYNFSDEFKKSRKGLDLIAQAGVAAVVDPAPAAAAAPAAGPHVTPVPTPAARRTKVQMAIDYLTTHKVATSAEIRTAMGLAKTSPPTAYLKDAIASGRICRDADSWTLGSGLAPEKKCATGAVSSKPAQGDVANVAKVGNIIVATKDSTVIPDSVLSALESVIIASHAGGDASTAPPPGAKHAPDHAAGRNDAGGVPLRGVVGRPDRAAAGRRDRGHADQDRGHAAGGVHPPAIGDNTTRERSMSAAIPTADSSSTGRAVGLEAALFDVLAMQTNLSTDAMDELAPQLAAQAARTLARTAITDGYLAASATIIAAVAGGLSICNDDAFVAALDGYMDALTTDERNTDRRVKCRLAIFSAGDAWKARGASSSPTAVITGGPPVEQSPYEAITLANLRASKLSAARVYVGYCEVSEALKAANSAIKRYEDQADELRRAAMGACSLRDDGKEACSSCGLTMGQSRMLAAARSTASGAVDLSEMHPIQPLVIDGDAIVRFKSNRIVCHLLDHSSFDMNTLHALDFSKEDREQFAQLIGFSLSGFGDLPYVTDETYERAAAQRPIAVEAEDCLGEVAK